MQISHRERVQSYQAKHYPPVLKITRSYVDGKVPETYNPHAEVTRLREAMDKYRGQVDRFGNNSAAAALTQPTE